MIQELGDNYAEYHADLVAALTRTGGRPEPSRFGGDFTRYQEACAQLRRILTAEVALRIALLLRTQGEQGLTSLYSVPLADLDERLVDFTRPGASRFDGTHAKLGEVTVENGFPAAPAPTAWNPATSVPVPR